MLDLEENRLELLPNEIGMNVDDSIFKVTFIYCL